jgi:hypothetical protein
MPDKVLLARLIAKVLTFVADALETAVTSLRTPAANDPAEAPAPSASDEPAPSATEMEEAPASVAVIVNASFYRAKFEPAEARRSNRHVPWLVK